jgi:hypothetical protein
MKDDILFQRGHIDVKFIGSEYVEDYDCLIPECYFEQVLGLEGEIIDSNGTDYEVISLDEEDNFVIDFFSYENEFETEDGNIVGYEELHVRCTGQIISKYVDFTQEDKDILLIKKYDVVKVI